MSMHYDLLKIIDIFLNKTSGQNYPHKNKTLELYLVI